MTYTVLNDGTDSEAFMGIATSDFSFVILRIVK